MAKDYIKKASLKYKANKARSRTMVIVMFVLVLGVLYSMISFIIASGVFDPEKNDKLAMSTVANMTEPEIKENILIGLQNKIEKINTQIDNLTGKISTDFKDQLGDNFEKIKSQVDIQGKIIDAYRQQQSIEYKQLVKKLNRTNNQLKELKSKYKNIRSTLSAGLSPPPRLIQNTIPAKLVPSVEKLEIDELNKTSVYLPPSMNDINTQNILYRTPFIKEKIVEEVEEIKVVEKPVLKEYFIQTLTNDIPEDDEGTNEEEIVKKKIQTFDIALGFGKGYMITGAYGPLFGSSPLGDVPVLIEAQKSILIPNHYTEDIDKCFLIGGGLGDPATNSVLIRLTDIQCIFANKKKQIRGSITGWVLGKDGKPGVKGKLISKSGQYIWRSMMTGAMQGFAKSSTAGLPILANVGSVGGNAGISTMLLGTSAGASKGMSAAFEKIAEFYLKMAEKTLPVIEVQGGQTVNIFLKGGEKLKVDDFHSIDVPLLDEYYSTQKDEEL